MSSAYNFLKGKELDLPSGLSTPALIISLQALISAYENNKSVGSIVHQWVSDSNRSDSDRLAMSVAASLFPEYLTSQQVNPTERVPLIFSFDYSNGEKRNFLSGLKISWVRTPISEKDLQETISKIFTDGGYCFSIEFNKGRVTVNTYVYSVLTHDQWRSIVEDLFVGWEYEIVDVYERARKIADQM